MAKKESSGFTAGLLIAGALFLCYKDPSILKDLSKAHAGASSSYNYRPAGKYFNCNQLEKLWDSVGGNSSQAQTAASIAMAESSGYQYSVDHNKNGTVDRGIFQINSIHGAMSTFRVRDNARAALSLSGNGTNWTPWVTYNSGAYQGKC